MGKYFEYFKLGFKDSIEFKWKLVTSIVVGFLFLGLYYVIWTLIYARSKIPMQYTFDEMMIYFLVAALVLVVLGESEIHYTISEHVRWGTITSYLTRPVNFLLAITAKSFGEMMIKMISVIVAFFIGLKLFHHQINHPILTIVFLILIAAFIIVVRVLIGLFSFWMTEIWGIAAGYKLIENLLAGLLVPLMFFPVFFQKIVYYTPFAHLTSEFSKMILNKVEISHTLNSFLILSVWILITFILCILFYRWGLKKNESLGG